MHTEVLTSLAGLERVEASYEALQARDPYLTFYCTYRTVHAWWSAYQDAPGFALYVICVINNGRIVGIAPCAIRPGRRHGKERRRLTWASHGDHMGVLLEPQHKAETLCKFIVKAMKDSPVHTISLGNMMMGGPFPHYLLKSPDNPKLTLHVENPFVDLRRFDSVEDIVKQGPRQVRKRRARLHRDHDCRFRIYDGNAGGILERMAGLHQAEKNFLISERQRTDRHSLFEDRRRLAHVEAMYEGADDVVTFCYEDPQGKLLAYRSGYLFNRWVLLWNTAYHPDLSDYHAGQALIYEVLQAVECEDLGDIVDFGAGRYPWKFEWTREFHSTYRYVHHVREPGESIPQAEESTEQGSAAADAGRTETSDAPVEAEDEPKRPDTGSAKTEGEAAHRSSLRSLLQSWRGSR